MLKRGQITIFILIGIVILAVVALLVYLLSGGFNISSYQSLETQTGQVKELVERCIAGGGEEALVLMGLQGGDLNPVDFRYYRDNKVSYLCNNDPGKRTCINRFLTLGEMEQDLNEYMEDSLEQCISLGHLRETFDLDYGGIEVDTQIGEDSVFFNVNFPIVLSKGGSQVTLEDFSHTINLPLGSLFSVAQKIINLRASIGFFDVIGFELSTKGYYEIRQDKPYPDEIYVMNVKDIDYTFQFAIEDEPR